MKIYVQILHSHVLMFQKLLVWISHAHSGWIQEGRQVADYSDTWIGVSSLPEKNTVHPSSPSMLIDVDCSGDISLPSWCNLILPQGQGICGGYDPWRWQRQWGQSQVEKTEHSLQIKTRWEVRQSTVELSQADKGWTQLEVAAGLASLFFSLLFPHSSNGYSDETYVHPSSKTLK